ncbi:MULTISPECIES: ATP-dependent Clp protease ATP-binding subunit [Anaerococcus]|uniref:ATP-dependent Clp protease ATP-binding subunit n=1 Tax=Anaerococcus TaxID=165779 RepID=UPI00242FC04C|nr:ATP-dependent Clp protease ATP-binding subunit [Anaerococcus vaginalis]MBS6920695.1 ATP-dependent Clp protease ATP-binding subunit [Anaerococcus vaginalis]MDU1707155.1 ATP-dependent Clp protease ATP-binding subunit [Anaerococcus vaginalis]MDU1762557.1 ATP-dependent Clp protease ATP-binding subunit [Anaerococcus vaginalis]
MENNKLNRLTGQARRESYSLSHDYIGVEHLLLALMKTGSLATKALEEAGANYELLRSIVINNIGKGSAVRPAKEYSNKVRQIFDRARLFAQKRKKVSASEEDVLLAILNDDDSFTNLMFMLSGLDKKIIRDNLIRLQKEEKSSNTSNNLSENLKKFAKNLNEMAEAGKIDPVIGREDEVERVIQILLRRTKNNPILIGDPGVGKTAIIEGLAQRIVDGKVPFVMKEKTIVSLDLASMIAGTKYRGDFEDRLKKLFGELEQREDVVLFIDEFHMVLGAGASEGSMDAANILKPILAKGDIQIIGATTIDEYRKHVEKDQALTRRMQPVHVEEPNKDDTIKIIEGLKDKYEDHHKVEITDEAIKAAVDLSQRYIQDRFLPDKAIDVIDEACSKERIKNYKENKNQVSKKEILDKLIEEKNMAINEQNFEKAASLRDQINETREKLEKEKNEDKKDLKISFDEVAKIVSSWSKVPITKLTEDEKQKYMDLDIDLKKEVIGQDKAIDKISHAIKRARVGLKDPKKPIGSFIFVGPTGVGKTYLAKSLAKNLFGDMDNLIRMDMSEYMEKFAVSRLVGSPPGYVGYEEGGQLTEAVRKNPYSVILFDEIEKAHPDIFNLLLQILDDGRLTDGQGRTVDFKNTIIIMTSNVGVSSLNQNPKIGFGTGDVEKEIDDSNKEIINKAIKNAFAPEFLNRLDDIIMFNSLDKNAIKEITKILLEETKERLKNLGIEINYNKRVVDLLSEGGFSKEYGARPLERHITNKIDNQLAEEILEGKLSKDMKINLTVKEGKINFANKKEKIKEKSEVLG